MRWSVLMLAVVAAPAFAATQDDDYRLGQSRFGAFTIPVPLDVQAVNDLAPGEGVLVLAVRPGGTADTMGIRPGTVVLSLNGEPIASRRDIRSVIAGVQPGDHAHAEIATAGGGGASLDGIFQPRQPRPPGTPWFGGALAGGGAPPWQGMPPPESAAEQTQELLLAQQALADARSAVASMRADITGEGCAASSDSHPWRFVHDYVGPTASAMAQP